MDGLSLLTLCAAGAINAGFALPMKFMRRWSWENTWLVWSCFALLILPLNLATLAIPQFLRMMLPPSADVLKIALFGALWGVGQVFFGFALETVGISLATPIMLGTSVGIGTLVPLVAAGTHVNASTSAVVTAVITTIGGVLLCAHAGRSRDGDRGTLKRGIAYAVAAGFGAGLFNFAIAFGGSLIEQAIRAGARPELAQLAAWTPFFAAGSMANLGCCAYRLKAQNTYRRFTQPGTLRYWTGGILMAALWLGSALLYGAAVGRNGRWGAIFAWPVYMSLIVLASAAVGAVTHEWRGASRRTLMTTCAGLGLLVIAVFVISLAQHVSL